jgi:hypothetical protein
LGNDFSVALRDRSGAVIKNLPAMSPAWIADAEKRDSAPSAPARKYGAELYRRITDKIIDHLKTRPGGEALLARSTWPAPAARHWRGRRQ